MSWLLAFVVVRCVARCMLFVVRRRCCWSFDVVRCLLCVVVWLCVVCCVSLFVVCYVFFVVACCLLFVICCEWFLVVC